MRIVFISDWFSEGMGYSENLLPKAMARLGHDVHVVTSTAQIYFDMPDYAEIYQQHLGPPIVEKETKSISGFTLHRLELHSRSCPIFKDSLIKKLENLCPDVLQTFDIGSPSTYYAACYCQEKRLKLFTECHVHESVFKPEKVDIVNFMRHPRFGMIYLRKFIKQRIEKAIVDKQTVRCYPIAYDAAKIAVRHFGCDPKKIQIQSLGVDTEIFRSPDGIFDNQDRRDMRKKLGLSQNDFVCIYTGRFTRDKNPYCLAEAVEKLASAGHRVKGLFVGAGTHECCTKIRSKVGCVVHDFVPASHLPKFYWSSDIGVWPSQESTSQLDAMACGLPLILNNLITVRDRVDGNGLIYNKGDSANLAEKIYRLMTDRMLSRMSAEGMKKIKQNYSWESIAQKRINDYINLSL